MNKEKFRLNRFSTMRIWCRVLESIMINLFRKMMISKVNSKYCNNNRRPNLINSNYKPKHLAKKKMNIKKLSRKIKCKLRD